MAKATIVVLMGPDREDNTVYNLFHYDEEMVPKLRELGFARTETVRAVIDREIGKGVECEFREIRPVACGSYPTDYKLEEDTEMIYFTNGLKLRRFKDPNECLRRI